MSFFVLRRRKIQEQRTSSDNYLKEKCKNVSEPSPGVEMRLRTRGCTNRSIELYKKSLQHPITPNSSFLPLSLLGCLY